MDPAVLAHLADEEAPQSSNVAGEAIDAVVLRAALLRALETLGEREREVVTLRYGGELDASEIAELTGLTHANVRKIEQRARGALRAELDRALAPRAMPRRTQR
jgi:RNA polymerase sigma factor (sigma-70 family)